MSVLSASPLLDNLNALLDVEYRSMQIRLMPNQQHRENSYRLPRESKIDCFLLRAGILVFGRRILLARNRGA